MEHSICEEIKTFSNIEIYNILTENIFGNVK